MVEQKLVGVETKGKEDKVYVNFNLKSKPLKGIQGIDPGNYIVVKKVFAEGKEFNGQFGKSYSCRVEHNGVEGSFWLNEKEHAKFKDCGGIGDNVKISLNKEPFVNKKTGVEMIISRLTFEKV